MSTETEGNRHRRTEADTAVTLQSKIQPRLLESGKEKKELHLEVDHRDGIPVNTFIFLFKHFVSTQD